MKKAIIICASVLAAGAAVVGILYHNNCIGKRVCR